MFRMRDRVRRVIDVVLGPPPQRNRVSAAYIEAHFELHKESERREELLDTLSDFGQLMLDEVAARTAALESKATSVLGWTTGLLALFVLQPPKAIADLSTSELVLTAVGVLGALGALIASALTLRVQSWTWPSQQDWFSPSLFAHPSVLRQLHLLSMLETHEAHSVINDGKVRSLKIAQAGLLLAGLSLGLQLVATLLLRWWGPTPTP